ncbi:MAG: sigma-70 family RNA polymerase sigma factor [Pyrinomonadaceae bacterium]
MSLLKRIFPRAVEAAKRQTVGTRVQPDYVVLVSRILSGDKDAEAELVDCFQGGVFQIILNIVRNPPLAEDLSQDAIITIIRKIRNGDLHHPESLKSFVLSVARYHAIEQMRRIRRRDFNENLEAAEQLPDPAPNQLEELQSSEQLKEICEVMDELTPRYKELLLRFFINEEPKDVICSDLGLTSAQFDGVLHRARKRYKEQYLKGKGAKDMRGRR